MLLNHSKYSASKILFYDLSSEYFLTWLDLIDREIKTFQIAQQCLNDITKQLNSEFNMSSKTTFEFWWIKIILESLESNVEEVEFMIKDVSDINKLFSTYQNLWFTKEYILNIDWDRNINIPNNLNNEGWDLGDFSIWVENQIITSIQFYIILNLASVVGYITFNNWTIIFIENQKFSENLNFIENAITTKFTLINPNFVYFGYSESREWPASYKFYQPSPSQVWNDLYDKLKETKLLYSLEEIIIEKSSLDWTILNKLVKFHNNKLNSVKKQYLSNEPRDPNIANNSLKLTVIPWNNANIRRNFVDNPIKIDCWKRRRSRTRLPVEEEKVEVKKVEEIKSDITSNHIFEVFECFKFDDNEGKLGFIRKESLNKQDSLCSYPLSENIFEKDLLWKMLKSYPFSIKVEYNTETYTNIEIKSWFRLVRLTGQPYRYDLLDNGSISNYEVNSDEMMKITGNILRLTNWCNLSKMKDKDLMLWASLNPSIISINWKFYDPQFKIEELFTYLWPGIKLEMINFWQCSENFLKKLIKIFERNNKLNENLRFQFWCIEFSSSNTNWMEAVLNLLNYIKQFNLFKKI